MADRPKQFKVRVSVAEHREWTAFAKKTYGGSREVSLMIRQTVNKEIARQGAKRKR